jgi:hypothetical protein
VDNDAAGYICVTGGVSEIWPDEPARTFLNEMERIVPWSGLLALVRPHYARPGNGRRPVGLEIMLRLWPDTRVIVDQSLSDSESSDSPN